MTRAAESRKGGIEYGVRGKLWAGRRRKAAGDGGARSVWWRDRLQIRGGARGGAHGEHMDNVRDAGGVEAQRLVERRRGLPRVEREGMRCARRGAGRKAQEGVGQRERGI